MEPKIKIGDAMNTYNGALLTLKARQYQVWLEPGETEEESSYWHARRDEAEFIAFDPLRLLGLVALWEQRGSHWERKPNEGDIYDELLTQACGDE
jgi:hypothetical protein